MASEEIGVEFPNSALQVLEWVKLVFGFRLGGFVMVSVNREELQRVVASVSTWPERDRITLARKIMETVEGTTHDAGRGYTAQQVIDLLKMPQPAPDDAQCQAIIEEELIRKYGP